MILVALCAMLISFLGQLPLGNMNMTATQLSVQEGNKQAWLYALGIALVEVVYLRISLLGMDWIRKNETLFLILGWVTVVLFLTLGILSFIAAKKQKKESKGLLLKTNMNRFVLGLSISAVNPAQIPFWFIWSTYLVERNILEPTMSHYNAFTIGAAIGSLAGEALYIHGGKWLIKKLKASDQKLNIFMALIFIATALIQLYKMIWGGKKS